NPAALPNQLFRTHLQQLLRRGLLLLYLGGSVRRRRRHLVRRKRWTEPRSRPEIPGRPPGTWRKRRHTRVIPRFPWPRPRARPPYSAPRTHQLNNNRKSKLYKPKEADSLNTMTFSTSQAAQDETVDICRNLIRIDTSNYGDGSGPGEREAAEYVTELLNEVGLKPKVFESAERRTSVVTRLKGTSSDRPALVVHGHLDVVPAEADDWTMDPFGAEIKDGCVWGRGAVDMKNMDAMILATIRDMIRNDRRPARDLVVAFFADEEHGGRFGSHWAVENRPELFEGATEAISEVGGYSVDVAGKRAYLIQIGEKGIAWLRLIAEGRTGHGSQITTENAVARLAETIARIGVHQWPRKVIPAVDGLLKGVADLTGKPYNPEDPDSVDTLIEALGSASRFVGATVSTTTNPTMLQAGYKANVVPGSAEAVIHMRILPGDEGESIKEIESMLAPGVRWEYVQD